MLTGVVKLNEWFLLPGRSDRNWFARTLKRKVLPSKTSTFIGVFGWVESHAHPNIVLQSALSKKPSYAAAGTVSVALSSLIDLAAVLSSPDSARQQIGSNSTRKTKAKTNLSSRFRLTLLPASFNLILTFGVIIDNLPFEDSTLCESETY